jgi:TM2 domain-containing membrane protein YozV
MTKHCPYCGETVPSYSVTCPKCYKSIPREDESKKEAEDIRKDDRKKNTESNKSVSVKTVNKALVLVLSLIPAAFGFMGLGQIYEGEYKKGLLFLCIGLPIFVVMVFLISTYGQYGAGVTFIALGFTVLFGLAFLVTYVIQAFDAVVRSLFMF